MKVLCVIPARYASTRLPGKPLKDIAGKPMICRVYDRVIQANKVSKTIVATDDERILTAVRTSGGVAMLTRVDHPTGTDRLAEVAENFPDFELIINVQGDEPLVEPMVIDSLVDVFEADSELKMATVKKLMTDEAEIENPNNVKVVTDKTGYAMYFSRSVVPYLRNGGCPVYKHIGIYAYKRDFLMDYSKMDSTPLEKSESLEQLRVLENGYRIKVVETTAKLVGVDTAEDLAKVNEIYSEFVNNS